VVYDSEKNEISFTRVSYDVSKTANMIKSLKLPRSFAERLLEGL